MRPTIQPMTAEEFRRVYWWRFTWWWWPGHVVLGLALAPLTIPATIIIVWLGPRPKRRKR